MITGETGTGKTTIIKKVCANKGGVIYVKVPQSAQVKFEDELAMAINYDFEKPLGFTQLFIKRFFGINPQGNTNHLNLSLINYILGVKIKEEDKLYILTEILEKFSEIYAKEKKRAAVLVIDDLNVLAAKDPRKLEDFQDTAKVFADSGNLRIVFVTSDGKAPRIMTGRAFIILFLI